MNKRIYTILVPMAIGILLTINLFAQSPEKMSYQAVIRNSTNQVVTNKTISMQISILHNSPNGKVVYEETQTPTTNANGLVSLEIGNGEVVSGHFSEINWASGPYFIKTETDPGGETNYTIIGINQLLSVPYALHAKTAETVTGLITETDPVFAISPAVNITGTDIVNLDNLSGNNTGDQDISGIAVNTQAIQDTAAQIRADIPTVTTYSVGDFAQGGVVFWVDETGQHGLVCAKSDQSTGVRWYAGTHGHTRALGDGLYAGKANTAIIISALVAIGDDGSTYAARICNELQVTSGSKTYGDWYLPSKYELDLMYDNKATINATATANGGSGFASTQYWSSTEYNDYNTWYRNFGSGYQSYYLTYFTFRVRAVRRF
jgi:hypothetical protein